MKGLAIATMALLLTAYTGAQAQMKSVSTSPVDASAAAGATAGVTHIFASNTPAGLAYKEKVTALKGPPTVAFPGGASRYPDDLTYQGGTIIGQAQSHAIYILFGGTICTPTTISKCWGNPEGFLKNLAVSDFIHVVDQYAQRTDTNRYTNGADAGVYFGGSNILGVTLSDDDIQTALHAAIAQVAGLSTGENDIYHVFIPPGVDECTEPGVCYSPDNFDTFAFCGYHRNVTFGDIGHVLYTVEPYQNVVGCQVPPGGPQGQIADSQNNTLSHELFETITDPEGDGMWNGAGLSAYSQEIGDECSFIIIIPTVAVYFNPSVFKMNGVKYAAQPEYSNIGHACRTNMFN